MADKEGEGEDWLAEYAVKLETVILVASDELHDGNAGYASRLLDMMAARIRASMDKAAEKRVTRH